MRRTLAGLVLIVAVAAAGVWAVAVMSRPTSAPEREPALVVPAAGSPTPVATPSVAPSVAPSVTQSPPNPEATQAPGTASAPKPSAYDDDDDDKDDDRSGSGKDDDDKDDDD
ncbi:hypothetical protein [Tessaracoccus sp. G1721]